MDIRTKKTYRSIWGFELNSNRNLINKGAMSSYLSGRYFSNQKSIEKLSSVLNVKISYLMGIKDFIKKS